MLHLKRASAGSGKTYQLAKMYIKLLLTVKEGDKKRRLGNEETVKEALGSIMAVTFTVKATAEMKQRIVKSLAELAAAYDLTEEEARRDAEYMKDFMDELGVKHHEIARLADIALRHLLLHYSDFKVQTIDSFFQSVLHTFAYEASLDDNFNMELDSDYINSVGFDTALDSLSQATADPARNREVFFWLNKMMKDKADKNKWNVFARQEGDKYLYSELVKETDNLEKEEFKAIKEELDTYFEELDRPFHEVVREIDEEIRADFNEKREAMRTAAQKLETALREAEIDPSMLYGNTKKRFINSLKKQDFDKEDLKEWSGYSLVKPPKATAGCSLSSKGKERYPYLAAGSGPYAFDTAFLEWVEALNDFVGYLKNEITNLATWQQYRRMFPRLVIAMEIAARKKEFLDSTNTMQISDTVHVLSRIIDKDDTPFVYERMGSRLKHFLIDEFQDTSKMQWDNLKPLLLNSEAEDHDNLIIGDAKQSIYRFRNADYSLIQNIGRNDGFHKVVTYLSDSKPDKPEKENTNFRSKPRIVEFNNYVFSNIIHRRKPEKDREPEPIFDDEVKEIYKDCIQALPDKKKEEKEAAAKAEGYVEILFHPNQSSQGDTEDKIGNVCLSNPGFEEIPEKILSLIERGYEFRDIGILVQSHDQGKAVVKRITDHNNSHPESQIRVISEENLLVAGALSIRIIVHGLEMAARGLKSPVKPNEVLTEPIPEKELFSLLKSMPALALPALVEAIAEKFVPAERRYVEAPFIAAFQDAVMEYCTAYPGDIGQFMKWWKRKSKTLIINSPEDSDGVKIQTIHKAKGLEFKCVIIPYASYEFTPSSSHSEWRWVRPYSVLPKSNLLPPYIPVLTSAGLDNTPHAAERTRYSKAVALDELNKMYVAFTRPKMELYVYMPLKKQNGASNAGNILLDMLTGDSGSEEGAAALQEEKVSDEELENDMTVVRYGSKPSRRQIESEREEGNDNAMMLTRYRISTQRAIMQFEDGNKLLSGKPRLDEEGNVVDPRSEGSLKHKVMQMVEYPSDLDKALREMKKDGLISADQLREWGEELAKAIESVKDTGWFDEGNRVINERPILKNDILAYRPDRIVVDADGNAVIVDYKFGAKKKGSLYRSQVTNYAGLLKESGRYKTVSACIWYVSLGEIEKVV